MKKKFTAQIIIEQDESGFYVAECPALKACYAQGKTFEEAIENIKLERAGFVILRKSKGSHWQFQHIDGRRVTIPAHKGRISGQA
jgi:predicted RNA binding protein YcfA (HicA-like mRNA interferase family)